MSDQIFHAGMLAWRTAMRDKRSLWVAAAAKAWERWIQVQQVQPPTMSKPLLGVVARLSCFDDIATHIGLAQIANHAAVNCALILEFPNGPGAAIGRARARRDGWEGLATIVDASATDQLIEGLPHDCPLLVFDKPAVLGRYLLNEQLGSRHYWEILPTRALERSAKGAFAVGTAYLGRASEYLRGEKSEASREDWLVHLSGITNPELGETDLGLEIGLPLRRRHWPEAEGVLETAPHPSSTLSLPVVETGEELVVRTAQHPFPSKVIMRRFGQLLRGDENLSIRLPGSMLGPAPRTIRAEVHEVGGAVRGSSLLAKIKTAALQPWMVSCFLNRGGGGNPVMRAFASGVGARLAYAEDEPAVLQDIPIVWGVLRDSDRLIAQAKAQSLYFFYVDHAYFDRGHGRSYRVTRNGFEAGAVRVCPDDRARELGIALQPWRRSGKEIIVCPPTDYFMTAHGCPDWLENTLVELNRLTERPIIVREKPKPGEKAKPLAQALKTAHALVTHSSNVAIESVCLGTPVFVAPTSAAAPVGSTDLTMIEHPVYGDREPWLASLAYNQFSFEEIASGVAWRMLLELEERELA